MTKHWTIERDLAPLILASHVGLKLIIPFPSLICKFSNLLVINIAGGKWVQRQVALITPEGVTICYYHSSPPPPSKLMGMLTKQLGRSSGSHRPSFFLSANYNSQMSCPQMLCQALGPSQLVNGTREGRGWSTVVATYSPIPPRKLIGLTQEILISNASSKPPSSFPCAIL